MKSTFQKCIINNSDKSLDCNAIAKFIELWRTLEYNGEPQFMQVYNFENDYYLSQKEYFEILKFLNNNIDLINPANTLDKLYLFFETKLFKGGEVKYSRHVGELGSANTGLSITRTIFNNNKGIFDDLEEVTDYLDDLASKRKKYFTINGKIKRGSVMWMTWDYDNPNEPFAFLELSTKKMNIEYREELRDKLALNEYYISDSRVYLTCFESSKINKVERATICDAGNYSLFRICKNNGHGYTFPISESLIYKNNLEKTQKEGRPEGVTKSDFVDLNLHSKIISI